MNTIPNKRQVRLNQTRQDGVTLIEVLVTVLVLAIGGLGIASMQLAGLKYTNGAYARTQSVILANDMIDRIRSNRDEALDDGYSIPTFGAAIGNPKDCNRDICLAAELADHDRSRWLTEVARALPSGQGTVVLIDQSGASGVTNNQFVITLRWRQVANSTDQDAAENAEIVNVAYRVSI